MRERIIALTRGLAALAALLLLLVGPPIALAHFVGDPLPSAVPDPGAIGDALTQTGIDDRTVIKILALLAWFIWLQITAAVFAEIVAQIRNRPALSLPVLPGFQPIARHLVAGVVFLAVLAGPNRASPPAAAETPPPVTTLIEEPAATEADSPAPLLADPGPSEPAPATYEYVVQRHDSLWSIAETVLGDGYRWREIRDLNVGRPQPDGATLTPTAEVIHPGWILDVPDMTSSTAPAATHTVERGEHLWEIAEDNLEAALGRDATDAEIDPYWREVVERNRSDLPDPANPSLIYSGSTVQLPAVPGTGTDPEAPAQPSEPEVGAEVPTFEPPSQPPPPPPAEPIEQPAPPPANQPPAPAETAQPEGADVADSETDEDSSVGFATGVLGVAGSGLAAVIALKIARRRRSQQARAVPGDIVPPTPDDLQDTHREIAARADLDARDEIRAALADIAQHAARRRRSRCRPRLVQVNSSRIEVFLDEPDVNAPHGWDVQASGHIWSRERSVSEGVTEVGVAPLLATLGRPDATTEILYDLEAAGATTLLGDPEVVRGLLRSLLYEIVHQPDEVAVVAVGDVPVPADPRVRRVATWDEIADEAVAWVRLSARVMEAHKLDSAFLARGTGRSIDGTVPMLVVVDQSPDDERFAELLDLAHRGAAAAVLVTAGDELTGTAVVLDGQRLAVPSLGLELDAQCVEAEAVEDIDELIEAADRPAQPSQPEDDRNGSVTPDLAKVSHNGEPYTDPRYEVLVRVLGQIEAEGGQEPLKPKQLGLVTFIATHPGCSAEQVEEALWPDPISSRRHRLHITLSQVRSAIGAQNLPPFEDEGSYRVTDTVRTDLDLFERRVTYADGKSSDEAIPILRGALELVTGPPFSYNSRGRGSFAWIDTEHWTSMTEATVVKTAWDLWQLYTDAGDSDGAIWAAHRGLLASPTNTELTNCLLRAYAMRGDLGAAERVYRSHARALDRLDLGDPEDSTVELWGELVECESPGAT